LTTKRNMIVMHCVDDFTPPVFMAPSGLYPSKFLTAFYGFDRITSTYKIF